MDQTHMKRRRFVQSLAAVTPSLAVAQQAIPVTPNAPMLPPGGGRGGFGMTEDTTKLEITAADVAADMAPHFFTADQFSALQKLSELLMPPLKGAPGALEAKAPEFLDFLIGESPADRQNVYRNGLDALNGQAEKQFNMTFAKLNEDQAVQLMEPLKQPWTYDLPTDPLSKFLRVAKQDVRTATMNSREYSAANPGGGGGRRNSGTGLYWNSLDS